MIAAAIRRAAWALVIVVARASPPKPEGGASRRLVVLGIDGMDPTLATRFMEAGRMPNLARLAKTGTFAKLGTSSPPESPVAWSDFITARHSDMHGIYDFVHRDLKTMGPYLSTSRVAGTSRSLSIGSWTVPISGGGVELLRGGRPFWEYLDDAGIPASVLMIPAMYPPPVDGRSRVIAGMGTPDLLGTYGIFNLFTSDPAWDGRRVSGGEVHFIDVPRGIPIELEIRGPPNPFSTAGHVMKAPFQLVVDEKEPVALVRFGNEERVLVPGEWSSWLPLSFDPGPLASSIGAMVRVFLKALTPHLLLYVSPINLDPLAPAQPFATPKAAELLAKSLGRFHTIGIPEDSKALEAGVFTDAEYLRLINDIFEERIRILNHELEHFRQGFLFTYFGTIDQLSHSFWRTLEPDAGPELREYANVIPDYYARIDDLIGRVINQVGPETPVVVMSDHGFASYRTKVNLNTWLERNDFLTRKAGEPQNKAPLDQIDWAKTRAYALGLNLLYVNLRGREPSGIVPPEERDAVLQAIKARLEDLTDPQTGDRVVTRVTISKPGAYPERTPDIVVGYGRGFRSSEASAIGALTETVFEENHDKWRGDHCMDAELVPGLLASTLRLATEGASLVDLGPTILDHFGVSAPKGWAGKTLYQRYKR